MSLTASTADLRCRSRRDGLRVLAGEVGRRRLGLKHSRLFADTFDA